MRNVLHVILLLAFCTPTVASDTQLYWGDTHVHTSLSGDSALFGNNLVGPEEAYRFAKGEAVQASVGKLARLETPLDFVVVADHAETLSTVWQLHNPSPQLQNNPALASALDITKRGLAALPEDQSPMETTISALGSAIMTLGANTQAGASAWRAIIDAAERHNKPGEFTALIGYEWSSTPGGNNLHRVVVYRDGANKAVQTLPVSVIRGAEDPTEYYPEALWRGMAAYEELTGGQLLAIPHNSNLSGGVMFKLAASDGPMTAEYARSRARWEPIAEITQIKGDSEAHPYLSPEDEFADFENWDRANILNNKLSTPERYAGDYLRAGLKGGLKAKADVGVNPFQYGVIGSTDSHTGLATADDDNFWGKASLSEPAPGRGDRNFAAKGKAGALITIKNRALAASGYAAVWAEENSREAIFDAIRRKEVYASTGPRITVRLFGGGDFSDSDLEHPDFAAIGYRKGVPMGGTLSNSSAQHSGTFMVSAMKDPQGANLDRIQIIKGWMGSDGETRERIYDVAVSGDRSINEAGRVLTPVGDTVDTATATYKNTIGAPSLAAVWTDPNFDARQEAFYYARVLEIPTPRWTTYDSVRFGTPLPTDVPATTQERAYTSAIWYSP